MWGLNVQLSLYKYKDIIHLQTAIPILIGTKFDDFVRLPPDVQWAIVTQVLQ